MQRVALSQPFGVLHDLLEVRQGLHVGGERVQRAGHGVFLQLCGGVLLIFPEEQEPGADGQDRDQSDRAERQKQRFPGPLFPCLHGCGRARLKGRLRKRRDGCFRRRDGRLAGDGLRFDKRLRSHGLRRLRQVVFIQARAAVYAEFGVLRDLFSAFRAIHLASSFFCCDA